MLPASLQQPPLNNTQYRALLIPVLIKLRGFKIKPELIMEIVEQNKVIIHCSSVADIVVEGEKDVLRTGIGMSMLLSFGSMRRGRRFVG